jgi:hypothetical protein
MRIGAFLGVLAMMVVASTASAGQMVWFEATPLTTNAAVTTNGASGVSTVLECDISQGLRCEWAITMMVDTDIALFGWDAELVDNDSPAGKTSVKSIDFTGSPWGTAADFAVPGQAPGPILHAGQSTFFSPFGPGMFPVMNFVLSKNKQPGELNVSEIFAGASAVGFGWSDENLGFGEITWGENPIVDGAPGSFAPNPVITIVNVPEPATLALLGLGALTLIRRRR